MLAVISSGHAALADWLYLIAAVCFGLAVIVYVFATAAAKYAPVLVAAGLCVGFVGFLVL